MQSKPLGQKSPPNVKRQIELSRKLNAKMKLEILKYVNSSSSYNLGRVYELSIPTAITTISSKIRGCSLGADNKGFFVYTHTEQEAIPMLLQ